MRIRLNKVVRDLWLNRTRSLLAILAIAIGITGFGSVLSTYSILTRELNAGYLATNPASATIHTDRIDESQTAIVRSFPGVGDLEERGTASGRIRTGPNEWSPAEFFIIKDFGTIHISTLKPEKGKWPPADGDILIERDAMGVAKAKIGDEVIVKTDNGPEVSLRISGTVHDVGQAQARMEQIVYGYINVHTLETLGEDPFLDQWKIIVSGDSKNKEHVQNTISKLKAFLESKNIPVRNIEIPVPGKHPHSDLMGTLLIFKASFGLFALLLSGLLVVNLISALMAGQIRQIGMMKAIGATKKQVMGLYLLAVLILSMIALALSIPAAILAGRALATFTSRFLNFDIHSYAISLWVFELEIAAGLIVPLLASLYPVLKGSRVSVREAVNDYGIGENSFGTGIMDRWISAVKGVQRPLLLSMRNTLRRRGRLSLILLALTTGGTIFMAAWNVRASLIHTVDVMLSTLRYDMTLSFAELYPIDKVESVIRNTPGIAHVESWAVAEARMVNSAGSDDVESITMIGPPSNTKALVLHILRGRTLVPQDTNALVLNDRMASRYPELHPGSTVTLRIGDKKQIWQIIGIARQPFASSAVYANREYLAMVSGMTDKTKNVRVITQKHDKNSISTIKQDLEKNLANAGFRATNNTSMADRRRVIDEHNSVIYIFLVVMSLLIVVVGGLGLMTLMSIQVLERRREIGVMRAIGATRKQILWIILCEGAFIGLISWILSSIVSFFVSAQLGNFATSQILHSNLDLAVDRTGTALWLSIVLLFGALASFLPARNASRLTVRELVEYE